MFDKIPHPGPAIGFPKDASEWRDAPAKFSDESLEILGHPVMEAWEEPYMRELAKIATSNGGTILEVGFGMGISAKYIQQHEIEEHIIIEANSDVFANLEEFAGKAKRKVTPLFGFWQDVVESLPNEGFEGILFDTYPIIEDEMRKAHFAFFEHAYRLLKKGGVFTYYDSEIEFMPLERQLLNEAGFLNVSGALCQVNPPSSCLYWNYNSILAPIIVK